MGYSSGLGPNIVILLATSFTCILFCISIEGKQSSLFEQSWFHTLASLMVYWKYHWLEGEWLQPRVHCRIYWNGNTYPCTHPSAILINRYSGVGIHNNRAFGDKFFKFCMHVSMGQRLSKLIASKLGSPSGGRYMQNPRWPPPRIVTDVSNWNWQPYTFVIPFFLGFQVWQIHFNAWSFKGNRAYFSYHLLRKTGTSCHSPFPDALKSLLDYAKIHSKPQGNLMLYCGNIVIFL